MTNIKIVLIIIFLTCSGFSKAGQEPSHPWKEVIDAKVIGQTEKSAKVIIETVGEVQFHVFKLSNPSRLVVEVFDAVHNWNKKVSNIDGNLIKKIRSSQYQDDPVKIVRVVLDMYVENYYYAGTFRNNRITILLGITEKVEASK